MSMKPIGMTTLAAAALTLSLIACAAKPKINQTDFSDSSARPEFDRGQRALEHEDYSAAAEAFDQLLVAHPATEVDLVTSYNSGAAHEGLGDCAKASERYREVVRASAGKFTRIEAEALFRLSLMYECLGQDAKAVAALLDTRKRAKGLPPEIMRAELPARLAAAYSRLGNRAKALQYFNQASSGLKGLLASGTSTRAQRETMGRTLFYMGRLNPAQRRGDVDPAAFLNSLSMQQPYLLQAVELNHPTWSRKAVEDLTTAYDGLTRFQIKPAAKRREFYLRAKQVIAEIRKIRLPEAGPMEDEVFEQVDKTERRLQTWLADVSETTPLTSEAKRREGLRREGRAVTPRPAKSPAKKASPGRAKKP